MKTHPSSFVQPLESRRFLSASPVLPLTQAMLYQQSQSADAAPAHSPASKLAKAATKKPAKPPSLLGHWSGEVEIDGFFDWETDLDLDFHDISKDSKTAFGEIDIDDLEDWSGRWTGITYSKNGRFSYTIRKHGDKVTIEGAVNAKSTFASGEITIRWDDGGKTKGDFTLHKWS
jgi:hypothetical protein